MIQYLVNLSHLVFIKKLKVELLFSATMVKEELSPFPNVFEFVLELSHPHRFKQMQDGTKMS